jgi:hypothetical protein
MRAYEDALTETSAKSEPWYVIPANHKWYRDLVVSRIIVKQLEEAGLHYPKNGRGSEKGRYQIACCITSRTIFVA